MELQNKIIDRVKLITGKSIDFKPMDFDTGTIIEHGDISMELPNSHWINYKRTIDYGIDIVSDFSNIIINKLKLNEKES